MLKLQELCLLHLFKPTNLFLSEGTICDILPPALSDVFFNMLIKYCVLTDNHIKSWTNTIITEFDCSDCHLVTNYGVKQLITKYPNLEGLKLRGSGVTPSILQSINTLRNLKTLDISGMAGFMKESDLESLSRCVQLCNLDISRINTKEKVVLKLVKSCNNIQVLSITGIDLCTDVTLQAVAQCLPNLKSFSCGSTKVSRVGVELVLCSCKCLVSLSVSGCIFKISALSCPSGPDGVPIPLSSSLRHLDISHCSSTDDPDLLLPKLHELFPNLESINLGFLVGMTGVTLVDLIKNNTNLQSINLSNCISIEAGHVRAWAAYVASILPENSNLYNLTSLSLSGCRLIDEETFEYFGKSLPPTLTSLNVSGLWKLSKSLNWVALRCPYMTYLDCSLCKHIDNSTVSLITQKCTDLQVLELYSAAILTDGAIHSIVINCRSITRLNLYGVCKVTDASMVLIGRNLPHLTSIDCSCTDIGDETLIGIGNGCQQLTVLSLIGCNRITNAGLMVLITRCLYLQRLSINGCPHITDHTLFKMADCSAFLSYLSMLDCAGVTGTGILELGKGCKSLKVLRLSSGTSFTTSQIKQLHFIAPQITLKL